MRLALMQPYLFPYVGYFHLVSAADLFVFYDDVSYIKQGWINRNRILLNSVPHNFVLPCSNISSNRTIREVEVDRNNVIFKKLLKILKNAYSKAPYFNSVFSIVEQVLNSEKSSIADIAAESVMACCAHMGINREFCFSSDCAISTNGMHGEDRVLMIAENYGASVYLNAPGGRDLYNAERFAARNMILEFVETPILAYQQFGAPFVPSLSILDVLMFNDVDQALALVSGKQNLL